jgi:hypothetical protein
MTEDGAGMTEDGAGMTEDGSGMTEDGTVLYVQSRAALLSDRRIPLAYILRTVLDHNREIHLRELVRLTRFAPRSM